MFWFLTRGRGWVAVAVLVALLCVAGVLVVANGWLASSRSENVRSALSHAEIVSEAYEDGCESGQVTSGLRGTYEKDPDAYYSNPTYETHWNRGFAECVLQREITPEIRRALKIAELETRSDEIELINYFYREEHRAFAINPRNKTNFWWTTGQETVAIARHAVLVSCGSDCKLFAVNDEIVWGE